MSKRVYFTIADARNLPYAQMMVNSLKRFHPEAEMILFGEEQIKQVGDPDFFYRATPYIANTLFDQGFDEVCKIDADTVITGNLDHIWEGDYDVAVVNNSNPREDKAYPIRLWNINPFAYVNCGFVVMKSKEFVAHWLNLCYSEHFLFYQMREQDLLNIIVYYGNYNVEHLDMSEKWHGLISKGYWPQIMLEGSPDQAHGSKLILPKNEEWPVDSDKEIVAIHFAGGNTPDKMKFKLHFKPEVIKYLEELVK